MRENGDYVLYLQGFEEDFEEACVYVRQLIYWRLCELQILSTFRILFVFDSR